MHRKYKLRNFGFVEINGKIYFSNLFFNGLVELDIKTGRIDAIYQFPNYGRRICWLYSKVVQVGEVLVFAPDWSEQIALFDTNTHKFQTINLDKNLVGERKPYFRCVYFYKGYLYMFPSKAKCILRYDLDRKEIRYLGRDIFEQNDDENYLRQQYEVINGKLFMPFTDRSNILSFDLETENIEVLRLENETGWSTINYIDETIWMSSWRNNEIYKWDLKTQEVSKFNKFPRELKTGEYKFAFSCVLENKIFYFPVDGNMIVAFDRLLDATECAIKNKMNVGEPITTYNVCNSNGRIFIVLAGIEEICECYLEQGNLRKCNYIKYDCEFNNKIIDKYLLLGMSGRKVEQNHEDLNDFIGVISISEDKSKSSLEKHKASVGKKIYSILHG